MIAALSGITTVGDFRGGDVALGGQGAPLAPCADFLLRRSKTESRIVLNIGGIANVTYLPTDCGIDEVIAFDTGPGNMILDELYRVLYPGQGSFDRAGAKAASGLASESLVETFLGFEFFSRRPPKSAGHHEFGARFAWEFLGEGAGGGSQGPRMFSRRPSLLTTRSIGRAVKDFIEPVGKVDKVFVSGGGSKNQTMISLLEGGARAGEGAPDRRAGNPRGRKGGGRFRRARERDGSRAAQRDPPRDGSVETARARDRSRRGPES